MREINLKITNIRRTIRETKFENLFDISCKARTKLRKVNQSHNKIKVPPFLLHCKAIIIVEGSSTPTILMVVMEMVSLICKFADPAKLKP